MDFPGTKVTPSLVVVTVNLALCLTLIPLTWRKWWAPNNASKYQMGFNSAFNP